MPGRLEPLVTVPENGDISLDTVRLCNYTLSRQLGRGRNAVVFEARDSTCGQIYAIKVYKEHGERVHREVEILQHLQGGVNIISFIEAVKDEEGITRALVQEAIDHEDFRVAFPRFGISDIRYYGRELLKALAFCHEQGVMHRDVRPHNVLINPQTRQLRVVGWGSAQFWHPNTEYSVRVSLFKAPELLVDFCKYDYSVDMWGVGSMLASMIFRREPFFSGNSISDMLLRISKVLGTEELFKFVDEFEIGLDEDLVDKLGYQPRRRWSTFVTPENEKNIDSDAIDLLDRLLRYNPRARLTAQQALNHSFFLTDQGATLDQQAITRYEA